MKYYFNPTTDPEAPTITRLPANIVQATDPGSITASVSWTEPTADDNSGQVTLTSSHVPGGIFPVGDTEVTYTAVDSSGNDATESFVVTIEGKDNIITGIVLQFSFFFQ